MDGCCAVEGHVDTVDIRYSIKLYTEAWVVSHQVCSRTSVLYQKHLDRCQKGKMLTGQDELNAQLDLVCCRMAINKKTQRTENGVVL